ncbi:ATP-binding cassette domain-containing protein [Bilophila sp.]|uniref:ATP-binding cassette domain-containing protein n=1 Tax=Bilophila sp. TaxID=1929485 RepID=UPI0030773859
MDTVLELENVSVHFDTPDGTVQAVRDVSLSLKSGETLAIVGESGCGKSVLCKSVMKLLPGNARISGKMLIDGKDIAPYTEKQMRTLRGSLFSMLFQDPMTTLNPTIPIGKQITEAVLKHRRMSREDAQKQAVTCSTAWASTIRPNGCSSSRTIFPGGCASGACLPSRWP